MARLTIASTAGELAVTAADRVAAIAGSAIAEHRSAVLCLTGGESPRELYRLLGEPRERWAGQIDWARVHVFWGDERHVPPDDAASNFRLAHDLLLSRVPVPPGHIHRIQGERADASEAADEYDTALASGFRAAGRETQTFDLMLLGIGEDAHIASVFPDSPLLRPSAAPDTSRRAAAVWAPHLRAWRITLTPAALLDAQQIIVLASGAIKAPAIEAAIELPEDLIRWPAQLLRQAGDRVAWMLDEHAATALSTADRRGTDG